MYFLHVIHIIKLINMTFKCIYRISFKWSRFLKNPRPLETNVTPRPFPRIDTASLMFSEQNECIDILCFSDMTILNIAQALYLCLVYVRKQVNNNIEQAQSNTLAQWAHKAKRQWPRRWAGQNSRDDTKKRSTYQFEIVKLVWLIHTYAMQLIQYVHVVFVR